MTAAERVVAPEAKKREDDPALRPRALHPEHTLVDDAAILSILERGRDERTQRRFSAAFRSFQESEPGIEPVPLLITADESRREEFVNWFHQYKPDVVVGHFTEAIDWIETREELDASRIGVFGISMGAIKGALISALDERVGASVLALAGGDIPYLLTYSDEPGIARRRDGYLQEHHLTLAELQEELDRKITCDPIHYAEYIDAEKVLMVLAFFDQTVPLEKGRELKEKMGNPETIYLFSGHYSSVLFKNYIKYKARKFFARMLPKR